MGGMRVLFSPVILNEVGIKQVTFFFYNKSSKSLYILVIICNI